jgi:hypothetical protein
LFLDYVSCLYTTVLLGVDNDHNYPLNIDELSGIVNKCLENPLLKKLIEQESKEIITTKSEQPDGAVFDIHSPRKIYFGDFDGAIYRCQMLKEQLKENLYPILILDSQ